MSQARRRIRLAEFNYGAGWAYHVVICTAARHHCLSRVEQGGLVLQPLGLLVQAQLEAIPDWWDGTQLEESAIMPDHLHILIQLEPGCAVALPRVVNRLKGRCTVEARRTGLLGIGDTLWQRSYHEHVIRGGRDLERARRHIRSNPSARVHA